MKLKQYVVDAFADRVFTGNPAAVCVTEAELSEAAMLAVAVIQMQAVLEELLMPGGVRF